MVGAFNDVLFLLLSIEWKVYVAHLHSRGISRGAQWTANNGRTQIRIRERSRIDKWVDRLLRIGGCCTLDRGFVLRMPSTSPDLGNALLYLWVSRVWSFQWVCDSGSRADSFVCCASFIFRTWEGDRALMVQEVLWSGALAHGSRLERIFKGARLYVACPGIGVERYATGNDLKSNHRTQSGRINSMERSGGPSIEKMSWRRVSATTLQAHESMTRISWGIEKGLNRWWTRGVGGFLVEGSGEAEDLERANDDTWLGLVFQRLRRCVLSRYLIRVITAQGQRWQSLDSVRARPI